MGLYQYAKSMPLVLLDPTGEAVVMFGGGFKIPYVQIDTGPLFVPPGFYAAGTAINAACWFMGWPEEAKVFRGTEAGLAQAKQWLRGLPANKKCEVRIVGYSSGCATGLRLAHDLEGGGIAGIKPNMLKSIVFYDFNWGAAGNPDYAGILQGNYQKPQSVGLRVEHVVSDGWVMRGFTFTKVGEWTGLFGEKYPIYKAGQAIRDWTAEAWDTIGTRPVKLGEYLEHGALLANTSGIHTAKETGQAWLAPTHKVTEVDHFGLGLLWLSTHPGDIISRLYWK
jgi:hypothetical protein